MIRYVFTLFAAAVLAAGCAFSVSEDIVLSVDVEDPIAREVALVCHGKIISSELDSLGHAELVLTGEDAAYARLFYTADLSVFKQLYLEKGDRPSVSFNGRDFMGSFEFEGDKAPAVEYLNTIKLTALPDEDYALPFEDYLKKVAAKEEEALKLLRANNLENIGHFGEMEAARIKYSFGTQLLMYPMGHMFLSNDMDYRPDESYYETIDSYLADEDILAGLDQYRDFAAEAAHILDEQNRNVSEAYPKAVAQMRFIADRFTSEKLRNALLHYLGYAYIDQFGVQDADDMINIYRSYVKDPLLLEEFDKACEKWNLVRIGKPSPDFKAYDLDGREYSLADFRGKYIYIDLWATWCGPCRREIPHLKALEEKYRDAQIEFVSISVDNDKAKWENMVREENMSGVQLYMGSENSFLEAYQVSSIPRFILLDKEGKIVDSDMRRPSSKYVVDIIDALEGLK